MNSISKSLETSETMPRPEEIKKLNEEEPTSGLRDLKGTNVYMPQEQLIRERITDTLKRIFKLYGYKPIETPILEFYDIAASKYAGGSEILKETYKLSDQGARDLCLRYELTFKLGKVIGMNPDMRLPFKRYEIGKVFRDGPVKLARLREFTQCDIDVVGIKSMIADAELMAIVFNVFAELGLDIYVQVNNRKILFGLFEFCGVPENLKQDCALSLDKLVKVGEQSVRRELGEKGVSEETANKIFEILKEAEAGKSNREKLAYLEGKLTNSLSTEGITEMKQLFSYIEGFSINGDVRYIPTLARGLGYYTGSMWEGFVKNSAITSTICGGGRWDKMIGEFLGSGKEYPATGITFGLDVISIALTLQKEKNTKFINNVIPSVLIIPINTVDQCPPIAARMRSSGISCDISIDRKLSKALEFAGKERIPFVAIVGKAELENGSVTLHNMQTGEEKQVKLEEAAKHLSEHLCI